MPQVEKRAECIRGATKSPRQHLPIITTMKEQQHRQAVILKGLHLKGCMIWRVMCGSGRMTGIIKKKIGVQYEGVRINTVTVMLCAAPPGASAIRTTGSSALWVFE